MDSTKSAWKVHSLPGKFHSLFMGLFPFREYCKVRLSLAQGEMVTNT